MQFPSPTQFISDVQNGQSLISQKFPLSQISFSHRGYALGNYWNYTRMSVHLVDQGRIGWGRETT